MSTKPKISIVVFPGSSGAREVGNAYARVLDYEVKYVWHQEEVLVGDLLVIPGGSAFGDYLRPGALCKTSPICGAIRKFCRDGRPVIGIGNGFQILCELGILPGSLLTNTSNNLINTTVAITRDNSTSVWTKKLSDEFISLPMCCRYGRYYADKRTLKDLDEGNRIAFRFCDNEGEVDLDNSFNGSELSIAGIVSREENVLGLICRPERATEEFFGSADGLLILNTVFS